MSWRPDSTFVRVDAVLLVLSLSGVSSTVCAQDLEPRLYSNTPVGMNFLIAGYVYGTGSVATDLSLPVENADVQTHTGILAYARALDLWGTSGKIDVVLPYSSLSGTAELAGMPQQRDVSGLGDPKMRFSVNLYGAPALSLEEFANYQQDVIVGASLQVMAPLGQYDSDKLVNLGTNRWTIKPEVGISKALGPLILELAAAAAFYTDNDDFLGGRTRSQEPLYSVQGHVIYSFQSGIWVALDGTYYIGGRSSIDGVENDDELGNTRVGLTVTLPVNRHNSVKVYASSGVTARGGDDYDAVGLAWQYRWGGGL